MARTDASRRTQAGWARAVEAAALRQPEAQHREATARFDHALPPEQQMQLVRELVATRQAELTKAYRNVIMVAAGFKMRTDRRGRERWSRQPCVVLVVRRKWDKTQDAQAGTELIPRRLLAFATIDGQRVMCGVPTDVQPARRFYGAQPQDARAVWVEDDDVPGEFGTLACAVELAMPGRPRRKLVLSARHVFSPVPEIGTSTIGAGLPLSPLVSPDAPPGAPALGATEAIGGVLRDHADPSFDAQLAAVHPGSWSRVRAMLADMPLSSDEPYIATIERFDALVLTRPVFELLVPDNHPGADMQPRRAYRAQWKCTLTDAFHFPYKVRRHGVPGSCDVAHWELLQLEIADGRVPLGGDSGSPLVLWNGDGSCTLVGMHIAGVRGGNLSYAIPSWQLFEATNYRGLGGQARLRPVPP